MTGDGDLAAALSKLQSAATQLGVPYEVLEGIVRDPALERFSSNREKRFHVYQAVAHQLGVVSRPPQNS